MRKVSFVGLFIVAACGGVARGGDRQEEDRGGADSGTEAAGGAAEGGAQSEDGGASMAGRNPGGRGAGGAASGGTGGVFSGGAGTGGAGPLECSGVFTGAPPDDPLRTDSGTLGLAELRRQVVESRARFRDYASKHDDTYRYTRQFDSFTGSFCETTIDVEKGVVVRRAQLGTDVWVETGGAIGTHQGCHPPWTMEELYDQCLGEVLCQDPRENWVFVHVDARGLLVQCGYFSMNCADDCYTGMEPLILTTDGSDWTDVGAACCPISPEPDCCMHYGGTALPGSCGLACDGMPPPGPQWTIGIDSTGCPSWQEPPFPDPNCCGCSSVDGGADGG